VLREITAEEWYRVTGCVDAGPPYHYYEISLDQKPDSEGTLEFLRLLEMKALEPKY
jgi:hypothetical protein